MTGKVKWFSNRKGYGFVTGEDGQDYFVHFSAIESDKSFKALHTNADVTFDVQVIDGKQYAVKVKES